MPIDIERHDTTLLITLNRPEKMNSLDQEMMDGLDAAWRLFRDDDGLWVAVVTGAGERPFCSGRDLVAGAAGSAEYHAAQIDPGVDQPRGQHFIKSDIYK